MCKSTCNIIQCYVWRVCSPCAQTILHEKLRSSDWEATCDAIEEAVARESYLSWLREHERREHTDTWGTQVRVWGS